MGFDTTAPAPRTRSSNIPTILFSWWCTGFGLAFIITRLCGRKVRNNQLFREDKIMLLAIIPLLIRMGLIHVVLLYGTNNVDISGGFTETQLRHRETGSKLVLAARVFYAAFIWMAKLTISEFLKRLTATYWKRSYELALKGIRWFLMLTFIAVVIATLAECQPFDHYWQVVGDPGPSCRMGYAQLITMGTADMVTDFLLIIFPVSLVAMSPAFALKRKIKLMLLFSLSAALMIVTGLRIKSVIAHHSLQQYRTVWASGEILGAAAVTNAIVIGSFLRDRGVKKRKYRYNSTTDSMEQPSRRGTRTSHVNEADSDDELFRDMCYRSDHAPDTPTAARPAPIAVASPGTRRDSILKSPGSYFPPVNDDGARDSEESDVKTAIEPPSPGAKIPQINAVPSSPRRQRNVSFCDVGGLLEDTSSQSSTLAPGSPLTGTRDFANMPSSRRGSEALNAPPARRGSHALLSGIGGLLSPILQGQKRGSGDDLSRTRSRESGNAIELTAAGGLLPIQEPAAAPIVPVQMRQHGSRSSLQDVGGLLSSPASPTTQSALSSISLAPPAANSKSRSSSPSPLSSSTNLPRQQPSTG